MGDPPMNVVYDLLELPKEFPFVLMDVEHQPFYSMGDKYHWHDCYELSYAKRGSGSYDVEERHYSFKQGELMIINNVEPHRMHVDAEGLNQLVLVFNPSLIWSGSKELLDYEYMKAFVDRGEGFQNKIAQDNPFFEEVNALILDIEKEYQTKQTGWQLMIKAKLLSLLTLFYRHFKSDVNPIGKRQALMRIQPVFEKIQEQLTASIDSKDMADLLHITPQHFSTVFKEAMGVNFIDFIISRRVGLAKEKLLTTSKGITEIAYESGFHNLSYFNHAFRKITGETPSCYRKHNP
jgi:AraC-like DNA-binding protein